MHHPVVVAIVNTLKNLLHAMTETSNPHRMSIRKMCLNMATLTA